ncbi:VanZ family protein [Neobacillus novalis]|uniref:VanZ family protein n=1 Tax=Neobacillus novalis TaxID=220687 RepID=A0AA95MMA6_9BACI|nr:VanZ family protein [Neobacillus novalis]WHY84668.1 VanZ family protein [Neobacillus novalis]
MKKYILLGVPLIFYGESLFLYFSNLHRYLPIILQVLLNIAIITGCMIFLLKRTRLQNVFDWIIGICFSVYFCILYHNTVQLLFFFDNVNYSLKNLKYIVHYVNLLPIKGILDVLYNNPSPLFQIAGNAFMLTPFAFALLYFKWAKSNKQAIWYSFLCTVGIEFVQFLQSILVSMFEIGMGRSSDIDDVILNTIGAVVGVGCYFLWVKIKKLVTQKIKNSGVTF